MYNKSIYSQFLNYDFDAPYDVVIDSAYQSFIQELPQEITSDVLQKITTLNTEILEILCQLNIDKLFITITTSQSLFYRFSVANFQLEFKLEVFFNIDSADSTEAVLHVYKSGEKQNSFYGTIKELTNVINSYIPNKYAFIFEFEEI